MGTYRASPGVASLVGIAENDAMTRALEPSEQRVLLDHISWGLYEDLLRAHGDRSVPRFTYDRGQLEIVSPSAEHEEIRDAVTLLVNVTAEVMGVQVKGFGSTTFRREDLESGFEPDACFYSANLDRIWGQAELDLRTDPPPDLVIEIDITRSSLDKLGLLAGIGVPEVWRYDGRRGWQVLVLEENRYVQGASRLLPGVTVEVISDCLERSRALRPLEWVRYVRDRTRRSGREISPSGTP